MKPEDVKHYIGKKVLIILKNDYRYTIIMPSFSGDTITAQDRYDNLNNNDNNYNNTETWIVSEPAAMHLKQQGYQLEIRDKISGKDLIGKETEEFGGRKVLILPATFLNPDVGTGLVHSVP